MGAKSFVRGLTVGAGLMYLLDAERGRTRRERLARQVSHLLGNARETLESGISQAGNVEIGHYGARIGDIAGLGAASLSLPRTAHLGNTIALQVLGAVLTLYSLTRRGMMASLVRTVGTGLLVGTAGRNPLAGSVLPRADRRRAVDIQKTIYIDAPLDQVYAFWSNYENFPLFMSHVREVEDLGSGRSRWSVSGPGGVPIEWNAVLTQQDPDSIAWRSEPGSMLENAGVIRFTPSGSGTRVDLRFCYHPPAGGAGQAVAELLGSDPRAKLNEDLGRMKALLEATHRSESHGKESRP
jgi:uncharacterized membrane protein